MAKSKYNEIKKRLTEVEQWARDGLIDSEIAKRLGISKDTFYRYQELHSDFSDSLKRGKEIIDSEVENALLKRALGYSYVEVTREPSAEGIMRTTKEVIKEVLPDTTAQIFWLKNRQRDKWKDKQDVEHKFDNEQTKISISFGDKSKRKPNTEKDPIIVDGGALTEDNDN